MRPTSDPLVAAGPAIQVLRGILFGVVFYVLRDTAFARPRGWLNLWLVLVIVGVLSPFGAAPSSIEGVIYTFLPLWLHIAGLPEVVLQAGLLAFLTYYWVKHPEKRWLGWLMCILFALMLVLATLGVLAALGSLPG
jgi:hypothetical protein